MAQTNKQINTGWLAVEPQCPRGVEKKKKKVSLITQNAFQSIGDPCIFRRLWQLQAPHFFLKAELEQPLKLFLTPTLRPALT